MKIKLLSTGYPEKLPFITLVAGIGAAAVGLLYNFL